MEQGANVGLSMQIAHSLSRFHFRYCQEIKFSILGRWKAKDDSGVDKDVHTGKSRKPHFRSHCFKILKRLADLNFYFTRYCIPLSFFFQQHSRHRIIPSFLIAHFFAGGSATSTSDSFIISPQQVSPISFLSPGTINFSQPFPF